jgi:hypothetical protein
MATTTTQEGIHVCLLHSGMEEFKKMTKKVQDDQWRAIDGIKKAAWISAMSTIGTLVAVIITIMLSLVKIPH